MDQAPQKVARVRILFESSRVLRKLFGSFSTHLPGGRLGDFDISCFPQQDGLAELGVISRSCLQAGSRRCPFAEQGAIRPRTTGEAYALVEKLGRERCLVAQRLGKITMPQHFTQT